MASKLQQPTKICEIGRQASIDPSKSKVSVLLFNDGKKTFADKQQARNLSSAAVKAKAPFTLLPLFYQPTNQLDLELEKERKIEERIKAAEKGSTGKQALNDLFDQFDKRIESAKSKFIPMLGKD